MLITTPVVGNADPSRRTLYRHTKRMFLRLLSRPWTGPRNALGRTRPVTVDSGQKQATGTCVSRGGGVILVL